jgi:hypothetical protein
VAVGSNITVTFSEAIRKGTGQIQLRSGSATGTLVESFDAATNSRLSISSDGRTLTIDPTANLANNTQYFVTFANGAIRDLAGNAYAGTTAYDFRTVPTPVPTITSGDIFRAEGREDSDGSGTGIFNAGKIRVMADFAKAVYSLQSWENRQINDFKSNSDDAVVELVTQQGWSPFACK